MAKYSKNSHWQPQSETNHAYRVLTALTAHGTTSEVVGAHQCVLSPQQASSFLYAILYAIKWPLFEEITMSSVCLAFHHLEYNLIHPV